MIRRKREKGEGRGLVFMIWMVGREGGLMSRKGAGWVDRERKKEENDEIATVTLCRSI